MLRSSIPAFLGFAPVTVGLEAPTVTVAVTVRSAQVTALTAQALTVPVSVQVAALPFRVILNPRLIVDTDMASDTDDVIALGIACALDNAGECTLLGVVANSANPGSIGVSRGLCRFSLPTWRFQTLEFGAFQGSQGGAQDTSPAYVATLNAAWGDNLPRSSFQSAVSAYRKMLAASPNDSVVIASIGALNNLSALLASPADGISSLTGAQLISTKVARLVVMGGGYPSGTNEYNFALDKPATADVFANWPGEIVGSGDGVGAAVYTVPPAWLTSASSPYRAAFVAASRTATSNPSWDLCAVYFAVRGLDSERGAFQIGGVRGTQVYNVSTAVNTWTSTPGRHSYILQLASNTDLASILMLDAGFTAKPSLRIRPETYAGGFRA